MNESIGERWRETFLRTVRDYDTSYRLREAAEAGRLGVWTQELTKAVVITCQSMGWQAAAKNHIPNVLPIPRNEYLGLDCTAFVTGKRRWRFPIAVFELENKQHDDFIAYSLWKVLSVKSQLRLVFCYRRRSEQGLELIKHLDEEVISALDAERYNIDGQAIVVIGSRNEASTFPYGFFKWWELSSNLGRFIPFR